MTQVETFLRDIFKKITSGIVILTGSGTETSTASTVTSSTASPVAAGKASVIFTTNGTFAGTILGATRLPLTTYSFTVSNPSKTLDAIAYTVTSGSMIIDVTV